MTTAATSTEYLARPEGRIAYDVTGSGPLVLLVPGMGEPRSTYRFLAPALVEAGYRVATTDLRGHGDSDATFDDYGDTATAGDVLALLDVLGPGVVVGNSLAAGAAVIAAAKAPDLVQGLVLVGPFVHNTASAVQRLMFRVLMARAWAVPVWRAYLPSLYAGAKPADFDAHRARVAEALRGPGRAAAFSRTTRADHAPAEAVLSRVSTPTLVVMGTRDPDFPDSAVEAAWVADALGGRVVMVEDAGHYPQEQQPQVTAEAVLDFLTTAVHRA